MKSTVALLSFVGAALAQGVTQPIAPSNAYPAGCSKDYAGDVQVTIELVKNAKRGFVQKRASSSCDTDGLLQMKLSNGILTDSQGRTGYIASNHQFQFDNPPQAGAIYTAGFSLCGNDSLALGASTTWWQCQSGNFWNLYDKNWADQCEPVQIVALPCSDSGSAPPAAQSQDGQIVATEVITTTVVKPISDGQPQVITTTIPVPICQIGDGQIQGHNTPCASITAAPTPAAPSGVPVSQYSDGQIQVTKPATGAGTGAGTAPVAPTAPAAGTTKQPPVVTTAAPSLKTTFIGNSTKTTSKAASIGTLSSLGQTSATAVTANDALRISGSSFGALVVGVIAGCLAL
ncbi:covalently-linked cell wall protein [Niveomyces insectorum RCEF 264]|uniref:Covalently-linked cell wall protein n=1 Tax=Niveomyces insectorum RCEF 264 TaxID=1081102 RepID=A0A167UPV4_9HYPO|nr:covalently-linked cell wall protein [Niveomyces insectorum RCEF 264]